MALESAYSEVNPALEQEEQVNVMNAIDVVVEACMRGAGYDWFDYPGQTAEQVFAYEVYMSDFEVWMYVDAQTAAQAGYGVSKARGQLSQSPIPPETEFFFPSDMTPEEEEQYEIAFSGSESDRIVIQGSGGEVSSQGAGGCLGEGLRTVYPNLEQYLTLEDARQRLVSDLWLATIESDEVQLALEGWAECMREEGYGFEDPPAALESVYTLASDSTPVAVQGAEVSIASADVRCKELNGLSGWFAAAFLHEVEERLPGQRGALAELAEMEFESLKHAERVLGS